jgi:hypothetical protein
MVEGQDNIDLPAMILKAGNSVKFDLWIQGSFPRGLGWGENLRNDSSDFNHRHF